MTEKNLYTAVPVERSALSISHQEGLLLVGSCFTENIGNRLRDFGFRVLINPFGVLYNPLSIAESLRLCCRGIAVKEEDLFYHNGLWHSWKHHGSFSHQDKDKCLKQCNERIEEACRFMQQPHTTLVTLGSAFTYFHEGNPVANCHKVPASCFEKRLIDQNHIVDSFQDIGLEKTIFTISPIRHWADGAHGNQLSKSTLMLAVEELRQRRGVLYFPSYEIVMDELRDYRFYEQDMLHPSSLTVDIIWQRFQQAFMDKETIALGEKFRALHTMEAHRPLSPESEAYQLHLKKIDQLRKELNIQ